MTKAIAKTYETANDNRVIIGAALLSVCAVLAIFYAFNIFAVVSRAVALEKVRSQTAAISSQVNSLDATYLKLTSAITPDVMQDYGLAAGKVSAYIPLPAPTASLGTLAALGHEL